MLSPLTVCKEEIEEGEIWFQKGGTEVPVEEDGELSRLRQADLKNLLFLIHTQLYAIGNNRTVYRFFHQSDFVVEIKSLFCSFKLSKNLHQQDLWF